MNIYTASYPRSGATWLGRLLSDLLDSPYATADLNSPLETKFCTTGDGGYVIRKTHWRWGQWNGSGKVVFIERDPRDVAVSLMFYRGLEPTDDNLTHAIESMVLPVEERQSDVLHDELGGYLEFVERWRYSRAIPVRYEMLHIDPVIELVLMLARLLGDPYSIGCTKEEIEQVIERQKFERWAPEYPHSMRKGIQGDWHNYFKRSHGELVQKHLYSILFDDPMPYELDKDWLERLPE